MKNKHGPLKLRPFIIIIVAVITRHLLITTPRFGHQGPEAKPTKVGTRRTHSRESCPAGNLSLRIPRPARALTLEPGPGGRPGGGASPRDRPKSAARATRGRARDHQDIWESQARRENGQGATLRRLPRLCRRDPGLAPPPPSPPPPHPLHPSLPLRSSGLARTVSSGSMRILKVCCCSVLSVIVTAMVGPERHSGPGILTRHATHAAAILAPSRAARRQLPGQAVRAPTTTTRDMSAPP